MNLWTDPPDVVMQSELSLKKVWWILLICQVIGYTFIIPDLWNRELLEPAYYLTASVSFASLMTFIHKYSINDTKIIFGYYLIYIILGAGLAWLLLKLPLLLPALAVIIIITLILTFIWLFSPKKISPGP